MRTEIFWIAGPWPGELAILPRPRGGDWLEDEVKAWRLAGIETMVSLLTSDEVTDLDLGEEAALCQANGINFVSFPIVDRGVPATRKITLELIKKLHKILVRGGSVGIHCRQSIGRSSLIAISLLVISGIEPQTATERVAASRGCAVPETPEQRQWVGDFTQVLRTVSTGE